MTASSFLPLGKLPADLLAQLLSKAPQTDPRVLYGPGIGRDCAVIDMGDTALVMKSDPITFATDAIGWYAVQVNANDVATTGASPRWMLATLLLPEGATTALSVEAIFDQLVEAAQGLGIILVGGHTEITHGIDHPILIGTLIGEVRKDRLVTPGGARPGDRLLLTKGVPIEATALLAREFPERLRPYLSEEEITRAAGFLTDPGISVVRDAQIALSAGHVTAMHDPTEGGLASALWELAEAAECALRIDPSRIPVPALAQKVCDLFGLDPLASIASGALLMSVKSGDAAAIIQALSSHGIPCVEIGEVEAGAPLVHLPTGDPLPRPLRDEITRIFET